MRLAGLAESGPICTLTGTILPWATGSWGTTTRTLAGHRFLHFRGHARDVDREGLAVEVLALDQDLFAGHGHVGLELGHPRAHGRP